MGKPTIWLHQQNADKEIGERNKLLEKKVEELEEFKKKVMAFLKKKKLTLKALEE